MNFIQSCWVVLGAYGATGLIVGLWMVVRGLSRLDGAVAHGTWGFRVVILPGLMALWPFLLPKIWQARDGRYTPPSTERPTVPGGLRVWPVRAFLALALIIPALGIWSQIGRTPSTIPAPGPDAARESADPRDRFTP